MTLRARRPGKTFLRFSAILGPVGRKTLVNGLQERKESKRSTVENSRKNAMSQPLFSSNGRNGSKIADAEKRLASQAAWSRMENGLKAKKGKKLAEQ